MNKTSFLYLRLAIKAAESLERYTAQLNLFVAGTPAEIYMQLGNIEAQKREWADGQE
jgi:uncharacterized membrane protein